MDHKHNGARDQARLTTFRCAGCGQVSGFNAFGGALTNERLDYQANEGVPICERCMTRARISGKRRRRIEQAVRRQCRVAKPATVVMTGCGQAERP